MQFPFISPIVTGDFVAQDVPLPGRDRQTFKWQKDWTLKPREKPSWHPGPMENMGRNKSKSSKDLKRFVSARPCTSVPPVLTDYTTSSTKLSTTPSTKRLPDSARKFTSRFTSMDRLPSSTTAAEFPPTCTRMEYRPQKSF